MLSGVGATKAATLTSVLPALPIWEQPSPLRLQPLIYSLCGTVARCTVRCCTQKPASRRSGRRQKSRQPPVKCCCASLTSLTVRKQERAKIDIAKHQFQTTSVFNRGVTDGCVAVVVIIRHKRVTFCGEGVQSNWQKCLPILFQNAILVQMCLFNMFLTDWIVVICVSLIVLMVFLVLHVFFL